MNKTKQKLIKDILSSADIHHNIKINWSKMPKEGVEGFDWNDEASFMILDFIENMKHEKINDKGNRNLCTCTNKNNLGACSKHDLWQFYQYGRSGATLYWTKYWDESNSRGFYFTTEEYDLEEMEISELKTVLKEILFFNQKVKELMEGFYSQCQYRVEELKEEKAREEAEEKEYQNIKEKVAKGQYIKRLVTELL